MAEIRQILHSIAAELGRLLSAQLMTAIGSERGDRFSLR